MLLERPSLERDQTLPEHPLAVWQGEFGRAYTKRNVLDRRTRELAFREMFAGLDLERMLEVGCNRGHNLAALACGPGISSAFGIEPGGRALDLARNASPRVFVLPGRAEALPFGDPWFDRVFTCGVLIHVPPAALDAALAGIVRCARRHVLTIENLSQEETRSDYRGHGELLRKRDDAAEYCRRNADLGVLRKGHLDSADGFNRSTWWLFERS